MLGRLFWLASLCLLLALLTACAGRTTPTEPPPGPTARPPTASPAPTEPPPSPTAVPPTLTRPPATATPAAGRSVAPAGVALGEDAAGRLFASAIGSELLGALVAPGARQAAPPATRAPVKPGQSTPTLQPTAIARPRLVTSYRMQGHLTGPDLGRVEISLSYAGPGRLQASLRLDATGAKRQPKPGEPTSIELIAFDRVFYVNNGQGWLSYTDIKPGGHLSELDLLGGLSETLSERPELRRGSELLNGEPCTLYSESRNQETLRFWLADRDHFLRRLEFKDGANSFLLTVDQLNQPITIQPPANARPAPR